ncbi:Slm4p Ecym_2670 [Eremothecium cymbalariae DBVPG|uniref:Roadblock/LAMTOR2 domain-containing protein n=1 Tax=Eremothecium cymbalariae (strain CBS 270.75 / DBVPG 7215 / KCTC 17166 / NRRL Y-17582) TaxID=931890 RepID=G8JNV5_ERECY|nr:Hypothetical protein Ecym_2670 [Eremothecium cymbalariae DBVPG\
MTMLHSTNIKQLLQRTLEPTHTPVSTYQIQSAVLVSRKSGSIVSFVTNSVSKVPSNDSINNLKMMALLTKEKWSEDEQDPKAQATKSCYHVTINTPDSGSAASSSQTTSRIYTFELEDLHTCVAQIPGSDLLLLLIGDSSYPHGLLVMRLKSALGAFQDVYGYKLD